MNRTRLSAGQRLLALASAFLVLGYIAVFMLGRWSTEGHAQTSPASVSEVESMATPACEAPSGLSVNDAYACIIDDPDEVAEFRSENGVPGPYETP